MMRLMIVGVLLWATATAVASEPMTKKQLEKSRWFDLATVGDVVTTLAGAGCTTVREVNPILQGASPAGVIGFFVARNWLYHKLTASIPPRWREIWLNSTIGAQSLVVLNNVAVLMKYC